MPSGELPLSKTQRFLKLPPIMLGRETKILLALLGTLSSGFVGVLGSKLFVPRPPNGAGPDVHLPARDHDEGPIVDPPSFAKLERSMFSATDSASESAADGTESADDGGPASGDTSASLLEPPSFLPSDPAAEMVGGDTGFEDSSGDRESSDDLESRFPRSSFGVVEEGEDAGSGLGSGDTSVDGAFNAEGDALADGSAGDTAVSFDSMAMTEPDGTPARFGSTAAETTFGGGGDLGVPAAFLPPPDALPIAAGSHVVTTGDTWWSIAERAYGDGRLYKLLFAWNREIDPRVSLAVGTQLEVPPLNALSTAHAAGLVHRDIKPSNVIITPAGRARLVDMGLARLHQMTGDRDLTVSGMTLGTFDYISPEQARDPRLADVRSDLYSLGCTVYYMLIGRPPFAEGTMVQKLLQHQQQQATPVDRLRPDVPRELAQVIERLMEKDPADRYQHPTELVEALEQVAAARGIELPLATGSVTPRTSRRQLRITDHLPWLVPLVGFAAIVAALWFSAGRDQLDRMAGVPAVSIRRPVRRGPSPGP